jgi:hypothetical protein
MGGGADPVPAPPTGVVGVPGGAPGPVLRRLSAAKIAATTAMTPRAMSTHPHQGTPPLPELDVVGVVWVALTVTDFELMMVADDARLVLVLVTVLAGTVTALVLVAVTVERVPASDLVVTVVLLALAAALEAESTTF